MAQVPAVRLWFAVPRICGLSVAPTLSRSTPDLDTHGRADLMPVLARGNGCDAAPYWTDLCAPNLQAWSGGVWALRARARTPTGMAVARKVCQPTGLCRGHGF